MKIFDKEGITAISACEGEMEYVASKYFEAESKIRLNIHNPPNSIIEELRIYRKYSPLLVSYLDSLRRLGSMAAKDIKRLKEKTDDRSRKKWSEEEDNLLIECICSEKYTPAYISMKFGRSPSAISNRVSYLVGVKRLSQKVAGRFIGQINGEEVDGLAVGTLYKEE